MPMFWRRRTPRLYKTVSSTSSSDDDESYTSDSSASISSSHQPQPNPHLTNSVASRSAMVSNRGMERPHNTVASSYVARAGDITRDQATTDLSRRPNSLSEGNQNRLTLADYGFYDSSDENSDNSINDPDHARREILRRSAEEQRRRNDAAFRSAMVSNHGTQRQHNTVASSSATRVGDAPDHLVYQSQVTLSDYELDNSDKDSDSSFVDRDLEQRERARRNGQNRPRLQWEVMSMQYKKLLKRIRKHGPEQKTEETVESEPSPNITVPLLRYQKEWLTWGLNQEASELRGGILADEMGMGKTLQAISLVVTARDRHAPSEAGGSSSKSSNKCTLIICPLVAVMQWKKEIERCTIDGSARVYVFHGPNRPRGVVDFSGYDFVLTTYSTAEIDYRKLVMVPKEICRDCGHAFANIKALKTHRRGLFCGQYVRNAAGISRYNGKEKVDIAVPSNPSAKREKSPLHSTRWERIILDEAHLIKDRNSNTAKAVFELESEYKWALTGTPLQNRVGELFSLIRFLQIFPYSYYYCKDCDCSMQDHISSIHCPVCKHSSTRHFCWWNKYIGRPIHNFGRSKMGQRAMTLLREVGYHTEANQVRTIKVRRDSMHEREQEFYEAMYTQSFARFNAYVKEGTLMQNFAHIFEMLTRLRQAVDHPYLVMYPPRPDTCGLCQSDTDNAVITSCEHIFCKSCWDNYLDIIGQLICPVCVTLLAAGPKKKSRNISKVKGFKSSSILNRLDLPVFQTSTKLEALKEEIRNMLEEDASAKGIVFSQFVSFLDLIGYSLMMAGVRWVQLDGSMNIDERNRAITTFTDDVDCKILLMSLKAGGVALNLVVASNVFLMDPWWNPATEKQAQDRIHRIGQHKPIRVTRFIIEGTIEERILALQRRKELLFEGTVGKSPDVMSRLTQQDLLFLFCK